MSSPSQPQTCTPVGLVPPHRWVCPIVWTVGLSMIFGAGAVCGAAGYAYWHHAYMVWLQDHPDDMPDMIIEKLKTELSLTEDQLPKVASVVRRNHAELKKLQGEFCPRIYMHCEAFQAEMQSVLTPEQYAIWLPHFQEVREIWLP